MVRWPKQWRPSMTWMTPRLTSSFGVSWSTPLALVLDRALGHVAALGVQQVEIAFSVVDLPAPLAPSSATILPFGYVQRHALEHQDHVVVDDLDVVDAQVICRARQRQFVYSSSFPIHGTTRRAGAHALLLLLASFPWSNRAA